MTDAASMLPAVYAAAQTPQAGAATADLVRSLGAAAQPDIVAARRLLHRFPEVSGQEANTQKLLCEQLDELGIPYRKLDNNGIIATIAGTAPGAYDADGAPVRRVALRADMDALPVAEQTGLPFASENPGIMHACGHDAHMAMMLGAVRILRDAADSLTGEVRIIFQPAEEISIGALSMIEAGALEGVDLRRAYLERGARRHRVLRAWAAHGQYRLVPHRHRRRFGAWLHAAQGRGCRGGGRRDGRGASNPGQPRCFPV